MYLSKLLLAKRSARNPYDVHKHIWRVFEWQEQKRRGFLFRVDWDAPGRHVPVLLQSGEEPVCAEGPLVLVDTKRFDLRLRSGQFLRFALCANPVKRLSSERCRVPLLRHDDRIEWLHRKLDRAARVVDADVISIRPLNFLKDSRPGKVVALTYSGVLEVGDESLLLSLVRQGIGPAKSFGCGLLSVARA